MLNHGADLEHARFTPFGNARPLFVESLLHPYSYGRMYTTRNVRVVSYILLFGDMEVEVVV